MPERELEVTTEARDGTLDLAGAEAIADLTDAAVAAYAGGARELVFDLRTPGRPAVPILPAIEAVADALDALGPTVVRCLVASERAAAHVRERLRATAPHSSCWRAGGATVQLRTGDITAIAADAVVNASNTRSCRRLTDLRTWSAGRTSDSLPCKSPVHSNAAPSALPSTHRRAICVAWTSIRTTGIRLRYRTR